MSAQPQLDPYLPENIRREIEQAYYARINEQATLEQLLTDPAFLNAPHPHAGLFADHGVVHVRDVATLVLQVLDAANGVLIPFREPARLDRFMKGYGVMLAYIHDIGMADPTPFGRAVHAEHAAQQVFDPAFDHVVDALWEANCGDVPRRLLTLAMQGTLEAPLALIFREMLAMATCHSKSTVPPAVLDDPAALRQLMQSILITDLGVIYWRHVVDKAREALLGDQQRPQDPEDLARLTRALWEAEAALLAATHSASATGGPGARLGTSYADFPGEAYRWLVSTHPDLCDLVRDVVDTVRTLRCADALRQRGTVLKTSGGYEVFVDGATGNAICALRKGDEQLFLLSVQDPISVGEANIAGSELGRDGNLRITFHRGAFGAQEAMCRAAYGVALVINDIQLDVVCSFRQADSHERGQDDPERGGHEMLILLERVDDNQAFADLVREQLLRINPPVRDRVRVVPSLQLATAQERARYLAAGEVMWNMEERRTVLNRVEWSGHRTTQIDLEEGFKDIRLFALKSGETLVEAGSPAGFVYVPLGDGLKITPLGGYQSFSVQAWMPVGTTGVIRGAVRNGTIVADRDIGVLMIPKSVYLQYWHYPYSAAELRERLQRERLATGAMLQD